MPNPGAQRALTPKQSNLVNLIKENTGKGKNTLTKGQMLRKAGYAEGTVKEPSLILNSPTIQNALADYVKQLQDKRKLAITKMTAKKLEKSSAYQLAVIGDILTKNVQLLTGNETERRGITVEISEVIARKYQLQKATELPVLDAKSVTDNTE